MNNYEFKKQTDGFIRPSVSTITSVTPRAPATSTATDRTPKGIPSGREASPLAPLALYEQVAERLRQHIFDRALEPGSWIDELRLCTQWGISRTPMREALKVLATEGLVTMKVRRGAYVTEMSPDDVKQVFHLLGLIESDAAATVAARGSPSSVARLQALHEQLETEVNHRERFFATNEKFHRALLEEAGNRWALQAAADLRKVMKLNRHHSLFKEGRLGDSLDEHRRIMRALSRGDASAARTEMQGHFDSGLEAATA